MDYFEPHNIEFLDLTGVDEEERNRVLLSLYTWDPNVKLPWKCDNEAQYARQTHNNPDSFLKQNNESRNINCVANENQQYPMYVQNYHVPSTYPAFTNQKLNPPVYVPNYQTPPVVFCDEFSRPIENHLPHVPLPQQNVSVNYTNNITDVVEDGNFNEAINVEREDTPLLNVDVKKVQEIPKQLMNGVTNNSEVLQTRVNKNGLSPNTSLNSSANISNEVTSPNEGTPNKSWASLFNKPKSPVGNSQVIENGCSNKPQSIVSSCLENVNDKTNKETFLPIKDARKSDFDDPNYYRMGEFLLAHTIDSRIISLQPRGLINRSNYCYINSILQALLACPPVYNLLCNLSQNISTDKKKQTPIIDGMSRFVKQFNHLPAGMRVSRRQEKNQKKELNPNVNCDSPFEPSWIYKILSGMRTDTFVIEGRQEDAEEFLGCLLNGLNDEMLELIKLVSNTMSVATTDNKQEQNEVDKEWQVMGPKNKGSVTRRTDFGRTPISDIFGGLLRSRVHRTGDLSTDNIQPFFTLQLNIEKATTVQEALEFLVSKIQLEGVTSSKTNQEVEAWQQVTIEELPIVLVLHLKCFDYKLDGCTKIIKALEFPIDLKIDAKLLSSKTNSSSKEKQYKLFAVVYHDGKETSKGHYITDAYHVGYASWLRYDDASVKAVQEEQVLKPQGTRVPYLLFYRRCDSIRSK